MERSGKFIRNLSIYNAQRQQIPAFAGMTGESGNNGGKNGGNSWKGGNDGTSKIEVDVSNYPKGVYLIVLQTEKGMLKSKFVVE